MASLNPTLALTAPADVDVELPVNGFPRELDLELLGYMRFVEGAAAVGADLGQRYLVDFVDLVGGRWLAVGLGPIVLAGLPSGLLGLVRGQSLGEGSGLALAGTEGRVELAAEALVLGFQVAEASLKGLAAGTGDGLHTPIIGVARAAAALPRPLSRDQLDLDAQQIPRTEAEKSRQPCRVGRRSARLTG
jgi:hypothetical protein